ncbi:unnamed protein product, partial [Rotaria socialis]
LISSLRLLFFFRSNIKTEIKNAI